MTALRTAQRISDLKQRIETLRQIIESTQRDDLRELLLEMLNDAERALTALEREAGRPPHVAKPS